MKTQRKRPCGVFFYGIDGFGGLFHDCERVAVVKERCRLHKFRGLARTGRRGGVRLSK
jgi:hypothetical protein